MRNWLHHRATPEPIIDLGGDDGSVTSPSRIYRLLKRSVEHHCLINVRLDGAKHLYSSAVLRIGADRNYLLLDALSPADGNARIKIHAEVAISTLLDKLDLTFSSTVEKIGTTSDLPPIRIAYPERVYYAQHRGEYRVAVPTNRPARISIRLDAAHRIEGIVRDLSPGGFRALLDAPLQKEPGSDPGFPVPLRFSLSLAPDRTVEGEIEICYASASENGKLQWFGARIVAMAASDQRVLDHCVAKIDRQQSRRR